MAQRPISKPRLCRVPALLAATGAAAIPLAAHAQLLGPVDGGAETNPSIWFSGESPPGSHTILNTTDVHSGAQSLQIDSAPPDFAPADWRSGDGSENPGDQQKFSLGAAAGGARPLNYSFWYKLPGGAGAGEDIRVDFRWWGANNEGNFVGEHNAFIGSTSGDTEPMTQWKQFRLDNFSVPAGANFADIRFSVNLFTLFGRVGLFDDFAVEIPLATSTWNVDADGNWSNAANWQNGVPNAVDAVAEFGGVITQPRTVTNDAAHTVGRMNFNSANRYTVAGSSPLNLDVSTGQAQINVANGSHTINAPLNLQDNTTITVTPAGSVLTVGGAMTAAPGVQLTKAGAGRADVPNVRAAALTVNDAGTLRILANGTSAATSNVATLTLGGQARLDLTNNALVIDYSGTSTPLAEVRDAIFHAFDGGAWDGPGITSSMATSTTHAVGYSEASALPSVPPIFGAVDSTALLIRFTRFGDANLDGTVNLQDFNRLAANFGSSTGDWSKGDFNYDQAVNLQDFNRLAANFGLSAAGAEVTPQDWANLASAIPEPGSLGALGVLALAARVRRRR